MHNNPDLPILVAGAGIGGLTAAYALHRRGFDVEIFEQAQNPLLKEDVGLRIWGHAMTALESLGIRDRIQDEGVAIQRFQVWSCDGRLLNDTAALYPAAELATPSIGIRRSALIQILREACEHVRIHFDSHCTGFDVRPDSVVLRLADGREPPAKLLIGAEGSHSPTRAQLIADGVPQYTGQMVWRGISSQCDGMEKGVMYTVTGAHHLYAGCWHVSETNVAWFICIDASAGARDWPGYLRSHLRALLRPVRGPLANILNLVPEVTAHRTDIYAYEHSAFRRQGPVVLLGSAAHAMPNVLGQSAGQTLEDAAILAQSLADAHDTIDGLAYYEKRRIPGPRRFRQAM